MDDTLVLIGQSYVQNDLLEQVPSKPVRTEIFGEERSATRSEWYEGGREGMKPECLFVTPSVNYSGQQEAELHGRRFRIYRTYRRRETDETELYLEEQAGVADGEDTH